MKLRLPHKFQAALMAALASVSFTTLSSGTLAVATGAALLAGQQALAETLQLTNVTPAEKTSSNSNFNWSESTGNLSSWCLTFDMTSTSNADFFNLNAGGNASSGYRLTTSGTDVLLKDNGGNEIARLTGVVGRENTISLSFVLNTDGTNSLGTGTFTLSSGSEEKIVEDLTSTLGGGTNTYFYKANNQVRVWTNNGAQKVYDIKLYQLSDNVITFNDFTWKGTDGNNDWSNAAWSTGGETLTTFTSDGNAVFGDSGYQQVSITTAITAHDVTVSGQNYTFSLSGSGSSLTAAALTIESGRTLKVEGGTVSVSSLAGAGVLDIASGAVVSNSSTVSFNGVKLSGEGTYALASGSTTLTAGLGDNWTGIVRVSELSATDRDMGTLRTSLSTLELKGFNGWMKDKWRGTLDYNIKLTNGSGGYGWQNGAFGTGTNTMEFTGKWSGEGQYLVSGSSGNRTMHYTYSGNITDWQGEFKHNGAQDTNLTFKGSATNVNIAISMGTSSSGTFTVVADAAGITFSKSVSANAMTLNSGASATLKGTTSLTTVSGAGALTVNSGSNTVAVTNLNSTGAVTVQGGTLALSGNSSAGATVKSGAKLSFASTLTASGTITVEEGGILYLGNAVYNTNAVTVGTLTMQDGAKLDLSGTGITGYETDAITLLKGGTITAQTDDWSAVQVIFNGFEKTYTLDVVENNLVLTFAQEAKELEWNGADGATWNSGNNWTVKGSAETTAYEAGSKVYFTSTADSKTVNVGADVIAGAMTVSGSGYSVGGSGSVTVSGNFTVEAGGSMSLANGLTVSGDLAVADGGALELSNAAVSVVGGMQVAQGGKLTLSNAGLVKPVLTQAAGAGEIVINAVTELNESFTTAFTGELTIAHSRTSGDFDLKLWGKDKTYNFSSLKAFNLEEGAAVSYWGQNSTINNLTLKGSAAFNIHATEPNNTPLTLNGTTDLNGYTLTMGNADTGWKRLVNIAALKGDASSKLVFEGGGYTDSQKSRLTINSLQEFSGTLELKENNGNNPLEATVNTGTGGAVNMKALNLTGTGETVTVNAAANLTLGTLTVSDGSTVDVKANTWSTQPVTIGKLLRSSDAANATVKLYSTAAGAKAWHFVMGADGEDYSGALYNGTLWVTTSNASQGSGKNCTVDVYLAAQDVLSATTLKTDNWGTAYNNTRVSVSLGTDAKVAGINSNNNAGYTGAGAYIRSGALTVESPNGVNDFASTGQTARTLEITGSGTYDSNAYIMGNVNLKMSGSGAQTFSGDVTRFDGTLTTTSGTLAFANAITAAALNGTGGILQANGGLTVGGGTYAGTLTTSALTVNTGTLTFNGGTIDTATLSAGTGTLAIAPGTGATVTFNKTLTNAGTITLGGEGEIHIGNITGFTTFKEATEYTYSGAADSKYEGSGFITGTNAQYYLIHGNGGSLSGSIGIHGGTRVTDGEGITGADYVFTVSGGEPLSTEYYVNNNLSYLDNDKDDGMDTAAAFIVKENVTFTTTGALLGQVAGRSVVLNQGSTLATTATTYFNARQMASLTLNGDATVSTGGGRIALVADTSTYSDVALTLNGHTLTVTGDNGGYFGIVGNASLDAGTIALQGPKFMLGYNGKSGLTVTAPDTLVTLTNGSSLVPAHGNRFILEGLDMVGTGSAHISTDGSAGNLTLKPDAGKHYTYKGDMTLVNLTLDGAADSSQVMDITADATLTTLTVNSGELVFQGGHTITVSQANNIVNTGTLEVAGTGTKLLLNNNGDANLGNVVLTNGEIYNNADSKDDITRNITTLSVNGSSKLAQRTWNTIWNIGQLNNGDEAGDRTLTWVMSTDHRKPSVLKLNGEGNFSGTLNAHRDNVQTTNGAYQAYVEITNQNALKNAVLNLDGTNADHYMALALNTAAVTLNGLNGTEHSVVYAGPAATASSGTMPTSTGSSVLTITGGGNFAGKVQSGVNLNITNGEATQTFSGDMSAFNGAIGVYNGKLAVTGNLAATELNAMYATLTVGGTLHLTNAENSTLDEVSLSLGGLTKDGAGTMSLNGIDHIGSTIQVSEGILNVMEGTYDISGIAPKSDPVIVVPTTTNGYASLEAEVQFITTSGTGTFTTPGSGLVITYTGGATANSIEADGSVVFHDSVYSTYYINDAAGEGSTLDLTDQQGKHSMLRNVVLNAASGTISVSDERSLDSLTQADGSTLNLAGSGELSVASVSNNAAIAFADGTSLTTTAALTVGSNKTFTTSGAGTFKGAGLTVEGGTVTLGSDAVFTGNVLAKSGSLNISGHTTVNGTLNGGDGSGSSAAITIAESGRLDVNTINVAWGFSSFAVNGALNVADNFTLATGNAARTIGGSGSITTKKLTIGNVGTYVFDGSNGLTLTVGEGGIAHGTQSNHTFVMSNGMTLRASANMSAAAGAITKLSGTAYFDTDGHQVTYNAPISDYDANAGILVKQGAGTLTLAGSNSFSGGATVNAGTLEITGSLQTGNVAVNSGATLSVAAEKQVSVTGLALDGGTLTNAGELTTSGGITAGGVSTITNTGLLKFTGAQGITLAEIASLTLSGEGTYDLSGLEEQPGEDVEYTGGANEYNGFAKGSSTVQFVDLSATGASLTFTPGATFLYNNLNGTFDETTGEVSIKTQDYNYTVFFVNVGADRLSNALTSETLDHIVLAGDTTFHVDGDNTYDISKIQVKSGATGYTINVNSGSTLNITTATDTSVITGAGTLYMEVPEAITYDVSFKEDSPFTGTLVYNEGNIDNHNTVVSLDDTFQGTLELRGRMNGHAMNLGGATTLRLVGDRSSNITGVWSQGNNMTFNLNLEVTDNNTVELWGDATTIINGTVNSGTNRQGHLSKNGNGTMTFNGAVALAEFTTPGGTVNFNSSASLDRINVNGGTVNLNGGTEAAYSLGDIYLYNGTLAIGNSGVKSISANEFRVSCTTTLNNGAEAPAVFNVNRFDVSNYNTNFTLQNVTLNVSGRATAAELRTDRNLDAATVTVGDKATLNLNGGVVWNKQDGAKLDYVNLTINNGGAVDVNGGESNILNDVTLNRGGALSFGTAATIEGALTISEVITANGNLTLNGSVNINGLDDTEIATYIHGEQDQQMNGFKQYSGSLTVVDTTGGGSVTVKEGTVITYKDAAGTLDDHGKFTLAETTPKYDAYYVNTNGTSESLAHALAEAEGHDTLTTVQLANGTGLDLDSADATLQHLVLKGGASASLNVTQSASIASVEGLAAGQTLTITGTTGKVLTLSANNTMAGTVAVQSGTLKTTAATALGNAHVDVAAAGTLELGANLTLANGMDNAGTISMAGKTLTLNGTTAYNLGNVTGNDQSYITVGNNATAVVDGNVTVRRVNGNAGSNIKVEEGATLNLLTTGRSNVSEIRGDLDIKGTVSFKSDGGDMRFYGTSDDQVFNLGHLVVDGGTGQVDLLTAGGDNYSSTIAAKSLSGGSSSHILEVTTCYTGGNAGTGKVVKFVIGDGNSTATAATYTGTIKYGTGSGSVKAGGGMNLVIKDEYVAADAVLQTIMSGGTYATVTVDTARAKVKGLKDATTGKTVNVSGTAADKNRVLEIVGNDNYTYNGKLGANLDVVHSGSGTQSFGGVDGFNGSVDVKAGTLNIMNIAQATSLNVKDVTIGANGTLGVYSGASATAETASEGILTIKDTKSLTAGSGAKLNANLVMESGSTLDVSGTGGMGLLMGSTVTLNQGVTLSDADMGSITNLGFMDSYTLFTGVDAFSYNGGDPSATPIAFDSETWVKASEVFSNSGFTGGKDYYVFYSGVQNGGNVGAIYVMQIPEPATSTLSLLALAALAARRRRKQ